MHIQRTNFKTMIPHIEVKPLPVNNYNDDIEDDIEWHLEENYVKISTLPTTKTLNNEKN